MNGWVINLWRTDACHQEVRSQAPVFYFDDGDPCWEVWFWHEDVQRWFVMSYLRNLHYEQQGVVYFHPDETAADLRARFAQLAS